MWKNYLLVIAIIMLMACKAVNTTKKVITTLPDGRVVVEEASHVDNSFTLGFSEGEGKTLVGGNLLDLSVSGIGK